MFVWLDEPRIVHVLEMEWIWSWTMGIFAPRSNLKKNFSKNKWQRSEITLRLLFSWRRNLICCNLELLNRHQVVKQEVHKEWKRCQLHSCKMKLDVRAVCVIKFRSVTTYSLSEERNSFGTSLNYPLTCNCRCVNSITHVFLLID